MRTRLKDVAERLNLSPSLVSGVLNGKEKVWASEETRTRIFEAARKLNYQPNTAAQALSSGKTNTIALVYRRLEGMNYRLAYTGLVDVFSEELQKRGYDLRVANFGTREEVLDNLRKLASSRACDAMILWGREADTEEQALLLESLGIPFIVKGRHEVKHPNWRQIDFDHEWTMSNALQTVVEQGHQRIAYLGFDSDDGFVHSLRRGYVEAHLRLLGRAPDHRFFAEFDDELVPNEKRITEWLALPEDQRPTGFVIGSGNFAWHALEGCLARIGKTLGEDYAAAGITSCFFTLMFGEAMAYQGIEVDNLARFGSPELLDFLISGKESEQTIIRFRPELSPAPTLRLKP
ncbi:MAG: LacI family DNA-binding transcriptional regulator [Armatimonadetes bacterium]|nr:LacI family DNA-binding transcriptional regulator [Armatimonadota bacterium]